MYQIYTTGFNGASDIWKFGRKRMHVFVLFTLATLTHLRVYPAGVHMKTKAEIQKAGTKELILGCRKLVFATADVRPGVTPRFNHPPLTSPSSCIGLLIKSRLIIFANDYLKF